MFSALFHIPENTTGIFSALPPLPDKLLILLDPVTPPSKSNTEISLIDPVVPILCVYSLGRLSLPVLNLYVKTILS